MVIRHTAGKRLTRRRSINLPSHRTSITIEDAFWEAFKEIAAHRGIGLVELICEIEALRSTKNRSSEIRVFVLENIRRSDAV